MRLHPLVRRLASPSGLILVGLCFLLPFVTASCEGYGPDGGGGSVSDTYTGVDMLVGGRGQLHMETRSDTGEVHADEGDDRDPNTLEPREPLPVQPFGWVTLILAGVGVLAALLPWARLRAVLLAGAGWFGALSLLIASLRTRQVVEHSLYGYFGGPRPSLETVRKAQDAVDFRYGFWLSMALLLLVGIANVLAAVPRPHPPAALVSTQDGTSAGDSGRE